VAEPTDHQRPLAPWGVMLPNFNAFGLDPDPVLEVARTAEELEFDAVWVSDHLSFHPPILEALTALAASAAVTDRIRLGTAVLLAPMRQPVWLAKTIAGIDQLAPGRLVLGVGVGGEHPPEWEAAGADLRDRGRRLDEFLALLPRLLSGEPVDHEGPALRVNTPALRPAVARPPIVVGGRSDAALRRSVRFGDAWMAVWMSAAAIGRARDRLTELADQVGTAAPEVIMLTFVAIGDDREAARRDAATFFELQYALPFDAVERYTFCGPVDEVAEGLAGYTAAGVTSFVVVAARPDPVRQVEALTSVREVLDDQIG